MHWIRTFLLSSILLGSGQAFAQSVDLFLVIGQSNARGLGPSSQPATIFPQPWTAYEYNSLNDSFAQLQFPTGLPVGSDWTSNYYSSILAFAKTWKDRTGRNSAFVVRARGGTGLTSQGNTGNGYWLDFSNTSPSTGIFHRAITDFKAAFDRMNDGIWWGTNRTYVIYIQGENDAQKGVSTADYQQGLVSLFNRLDAEMASRRSFSGFFIAETGYFHGTPAYGAPDPLLVHRQKVNAIAAAQHGAGAQGKVVLTSKAARVFASPCINGAGGAGCLLRSDDLIHYQTPGYELVGAEMARYGAIYDSTGLKPLLASSCGASPSTCGPTVDVYRWYNGADHAHSVGEGSLATFDALGYDFKGVRFHLFADAAPGRVALYSKFNSQTGDSMDTVDPNEGNPAYGNATLLGYCYSSPASNAEVPLKRLRLNNNRVTSKDSAEISALQANGYIMEATLCYTN